MTRPTNTRVKHEKEDTWRHDASNPMALGCTGCPLRNECGGLFVQGPAFDCRDFCDCQESADCDAVCFENPERFAARYHEVKGFSLANVPRAPPVPFRSLNGYAPLIYHGSCREEPLDYGLVALDLYSLIDRQAGRTKYQSREELADALGISRTARVIVTGTAKDAPLERWWELLTRHDIIVALRELQVDLVTSPNYSLFNDVPRPDNLYNLKRIGLATAEFLKMGVPCALHVNARTDRDYERWAEFIADRNEINAIAFEFATGARNPQRMRWHTERLCELAERATRPLQLVIRGGLRVVTDLTAAFRSVVFIDSDPFIKAQKRRQLLAIDDGSFRTMFRPTAIGESLDDLLRTNIEVGQARYERALRGEFVASTVGRETNGRQSKAAFHGYEKSTQPDLLSELRLRECRAPTIDRERVVAASKPEKAVKVGEALEDPMKAPAVPALTAEPRTAVGQRRYQCGPNIP